MRDRLHSCINLCDPQIEGWFRTRQNFRNNTEYRNLQKVSFESVSRKKRPIHPIACVSGSATIKNYREITHA